MKIAVLITIATAAMSLHAVADDLRAEGFKKLTGAQIRAAFSGHTFADDVHFSFHYAPSGAIEGMSMGAKAARRWRVQKDELCEADAIDENCFSIWRSGTVVRLVIGDDGVFTEGTLK
jgi:hypothetical protein